MKYPVIAIILLLAASSPAMAQYESADRQQYEAQQQAQETQRAEQDGETQERAERDVEQMHRYDN